jgi:hypothetical protein
MPRADVKIACRGQPPVIEAMNGPFVDFYGGVDLGESGCHSPSQLPISLRVFGNLGTGTHVVRLRLQVLTQEWAATTNPRTAHAFFNKSAHAHFARLRLRPILIPRLTTRLLRCGINDAFFTYRPIETDGTSGDITAGPSVGSCKLSRSRRASRHSSPHVASYSSRSRFLVSSSWRVIQQCGMLPIELGSTSKHKGGSIPMIWKLTTGMRAAFRFSTGSLAAARDSGDPRGNSSGLGLLFGPVAWRVSVKPSQPRDGTFSKRRSRWQL